MLTSQYPHRCIPNHDGALPDGARTVATAFGDAGYSTAYYGKWHVDGRIHREAETRPVFQHVNRYVHGHDASGQEVGQYKPEGYETDALTDLLIADLERRRSDEPFFSVLSVQPPHSPYVAPPEFLERYSAEEIVLRPNVPPVERFRSEARESLAGYYAMIEDLDANVGRVIETLARTGLAENTYVVFFSDHGDMHGSQARTLKCVPWEASIRIPFIVRGPQKPATEITENTEEGPLDVHRDLHCVGA